ncbi:MAG: methylenetetrahydrofolate reductase, partial [Planctomycetota bacterium]
MSTNNITFREMLASDRFYYGAEVVSGRGFVPSGSPNQLVELSEQLLNDPRIGWISLCENPGGNPMLPPDWLGQNLPEAKDRMVLHFTCKDLNRNGLESAAWRYAALGLNNLLAMTGDYPREGYGGAATPVFDLDSVSLISMLNAMNRGLEVTGPRGKTETLAKTNFFIGCVASPFKRYERELMPQYFKLLRKIASGAQFVTTQLGYDMRKFYEVKLCLDDNGLNIPVVGYVYLLNKVVAGMFNRSEIPGCTVSDELLNLANKYANGTDKGRSFFHEFAAKQLAVLKGLGFAAAHIGGITKVETFDEIIDMAESFGVNDWRDFAREIQYPQPDEFYLYEQDPETGLGIPQQFNSEYLKSLEDPKRSKEITLFYRLSRRIHHAFFEPDRGCFNFMKRLYTRWDQKNGFMSSALRVL